METEKRMFTVDPTVSMNNVASKVLQRFLGLLQDRSFSTKLLYNQTCCKGNNADLSIHGFTVPIYTLTLKRVHDLSFLVKKKTKPQISIL